MYWKYKEWIYIYIENPFKTMKGLKGVFRPLKCYFRCSKYWTPVLWCSKPSSIQIMASDVGWKDKFDTPRFEYPPYIWIHLFGINFVWYWSLYPHQPLDEMDYWEQALWYLYYYTNISYGKLNAPDIKKAKESWPWVGENNKSSWKDKFLINK